MKNGKLHILETDLSDLYQPDICELEAAFPEAIIEHFEIERPWADPEENRATILKDLQYRSAIRLGPPHSGDSSIGQKIWFVEDTTWRPLETCDIVVLNYEFRHKVAVPPSNGMVREDWPYGRGALDLVHETFARFRPEAQIIALHPDGLWPGQIVNGACVVHGPALIDLIKSTYELMK